MRLFLLYGIFISISFVNRAQVHVQDTDDLIKTSIYFGGGSYYIDHDQIDNLAVFIDSVQNLEHYEIVIFSHTDNIGGREYNEWLSNMRSNAVKSELLRLNIPEAQLKIRDFGMENPLYTNYTSSGRRANRRVDVILVPITF